MKSYHEGQVIAAANVLLSQEGAGREWIALAAPEQGNLRDRVKAILDAADSAAKAHHEEHIITARIWKRTSTEEWVLELAGTINDANFTSTHTQAGTLAPQDVAGLPEHYEWHERLVAAGLAEEV